MSSIYIKEPATGGKVCLHTTLGDIDIELWTRECPLACRNFIQLCLNGYYNNVLFHRLVKQFIVQTGDPTGTGEGGESFNGKFFKNEFHQRLKFIRRGLVGMASEKDGLNGSQFFFTLSETPDLNNKHTLFGKVVSNTIYNLLKFNDCEVDKNNRPTKNYFIKSATVVLNPYNDIQLSQREEKKIQVKRKKEKADVALLKNTNLLSFGDEIDEDAIDVKKFKSISAHDVLNDELLSKQKAIEGNEIGQNSESDVEEDLSNNAKYERLKRIKNKLKLGKSQTTNDSKHQKLNICEGQNHEYEDLDDVMDEHKKIENQSKLEELSKELKSLQKEFVRSVRTKPNIIDDEPPSDAMKSYNKMKLKFKSGSKNLVKTVNNKREVQTMGLLERFNTKIARASVTGILIDKKVDMSDQQTQDEIILATLNDQGKLEIDSKDLTTSDWLSHKLVAPEGIRKDARDANLKDSDQEWYAIGDPRNKLNIQKS